MKRYGLKCIGFVAFCAIGVTSLRAQPSARDMEKIRAISYQQGKVVPSDSLIFKLLFLLILKRV